jgi:hypothetical protein
MNELLHKYNPYFSKEEKCNNELIKLKQEFKKIKSDYNWIKNNSLKETKNKYEKINKLIFQNKGSKIKLEKSSLIIKENIRKLKKRHKGTHVNFLWLKWMLVDNEVEENILLKLKEEKKKLGLEESKLKVINKDLNDLTKEGNYFLEKLKIYNKLDERFIENEIELRDFEIRKLDENRKFLENKNELINHSIEKFINEISKINENILQLENQIKKAEQYDFNLSNANSPRGRAIIHDKCFNEFREGSPKKIISKLEKLKEKYLRNLVKIEKRIENLINKYSKSIKSIIIDGNNLCYENSNFIGLKALIKISSILSEKYSITIIFDASIRNILKQNDDSIRSKFKKTIKTHIVPSKEKADEIILDLASVNKNTFVISNDRFIDFFEKDAVKGKRLIKHSIISNRVLINELDFNEIF